MLSILIPTYNFSVFKLVEELHRQAENCKIAYEILIYDDASSLFLEENEQINSLQNCQYKILDKNIGRSAIRNLLAKEAKYENLLFLDADTLPVNLNFIAAYLPFIENPEIVVYGGIVYQEEAPEKSKILRWKYGRSREAHPVNERNKKKYLRFLTLNFFIKKSVFEKVRFNEKMPNLRHEDTLFGQDLKQARIEVAHIDNPVLHLGLENNADFLEKSLASVATLHDFVKQGILDEKDVKLSAYAKKIKKIIGLKGLFIFFYTRNKKRLYRNLISGNPSLLVFDLYRLGYFFELKQQDYV